MARRKTDAGPDPIPTLLSVTIFLLSCVVWACSRPPISGPWWGPLTQLKTRAVRSCGAALAASGAWDAQVMSPSPDSSVDWWVETHPVISRFDLLPPQWAPPPACLVTYGPTTRDGHKVLWDVGYYARPPAPPCVVYSFGGNLQVEFEEALLASTPCEVWVFDCTVGGSGMAAVLLEHPGRLHFLPYCVGVEGQALRLDYAGRSVTTVLRSIASIAAELGHAGARGNGTRGVDILKIDVEGAEHDALPAYLANATTLPSQISVEVHAWGRSAGDMRKTLRLLQSVYRAGYVLVSHEVNPFGRECCRELTFVLGCEWEGRVQECAGGGAGAAAPTPPAASTSG